MENTNPTNQSRFLIAAALSMAILLGWSYFMAPAPTPGGNSNTAANTAPQPASTAQPQPEVTQAAILPASDVPRRELTIKTPLYEVKLDSKGALATSWVILKNVSPKAQFPVFADGSTDTEKKPLQLISQKALEQTPREIPFRIVTGDAALDLLINEGTYTIEGADDSSVELAGQESRTVEFVLRSDVMLAGATQP